MKLKKLPKTLKLKDILLFFSIIFSTQIYAQVPADAIFRNGDLEITFVTFSGTNYTIQWDDVGSGANSNGAFYRHKLTGMTGFHSLGDLAINNYNPNGQVMAVVRDASAAGDLLVSPTDFVQVWNDAGSGANRNGSVWRPTCPAGYTGMGLVARAPGKPALDVIKCIKDSYVVEGEAGNGIWNDLGSGSDADFSSWSIEAPTAAAGSGTTNISPGTFIGHNTYGAPSSGVYALILPIADSVPVDADVPQRPVLTSFNQPNPYSDNGTLSVSYLPWYAVRDTVLTAAQQITQTPTYRMVRETRYKLIFFIHNETSTISDNNKSFTWGTSGSKSESYTKRTGIKMVATFKPPLSPFSASVTLKKKFTHTTGSSSAWSQESTDMLNLKVQPNQAGAAYLLESQYKLYRADGSIVYQELDHSPSSSYFTTSYPNNADVSQIELLELKVYPAPVTLGENLHIDLPTSEIFHIEVKDLTGRVVYSLSNVHNALDLNSSELYKGIFIVSVYNENQTFDKKIIVQ